MKRSTGIIVILGLVVAGCSWGGLGAGTVGPSATAGGPVSTGSAGATGVVADPGATPAPLPVAEIVTADANIAGSLGTYDLDGVGGASPWLPFETLPGISVGDRDDLTIVFVDGVPIGSFEVDGAAASDPSGRSAQRVAARMVGADRRSVTVGPLPAGRWVLAAHLSRADGRGDGLSYWAVTVR